jgi:hypothetical protein
MTADLRRLNPQPGDAGAGSKLGRRKCEGGDAAVAALHRKLRHVLEERTALLRDITRLVQELDAVTPPSREGLEGEVPHDRANVARPRWPYLMAPVVADCCIGHSAEFLVRTGRLILGPGWMIPTAATGMVLLTTIAALSHLSRVCARITSACRQWPAPADGRMVIDGKRATPSAEFDQP